MSKSNVDLVQQLYGAFGKGDIPTLMNSMSADIAWHSGGRASDFPGFGPRNGHAEVQEFFKLIAENNEFSHFTPREFYAAGDKVFVLGDYELTLRKTGKTFASDWAHIFTLRDGKVTGFREFLDTALAAECYRG